MQRDEIFEKVMHNAPIHRKDAEWLYLHGALEDLAFLAGKVRRRYHPPSIATYLIMGIINYTNTCVAKCDYCAFYRLPHSPEAYTLPFETLVQRVQGIIDLGGSLVSFNGGFNPNLSIEDYVKFFADIHKLFPQITFYDMTVAEFMFICKRARISYAEGAMEFKSVGVQWITGGGSEILDDAFRMRHSPGKYKVEDYFAAQRAVLEAGLGSTATMVIGFDETLEERLNHLEKLRTFQDSCENKLPSFLVWTYKPYNTSLGGKEASLEEYLRWLAICRIYLDNFVHIRASVLTRNEGALQGLNFGANDFDLPTEDEVTQKAGAMISHEFDQILQSAVKEGFITQHRPPFPISLRLGEKVFLTTKDQVKDNAASFLS